MQVCCFEWYLPEHSPKRLHPWGQKPLCIIRSSKALHSPSHIDTNAPYQNSGAAMHLQRLLGSLPTFAVGHVAAASSQILQQINHLAARPADAAAAQLLSSRLAAALQPQQGD